jgi:hypothetical protein
MSFFPKNSSLIDNCSRKAVLRKKEYKHVRNVMTFQAYVAGCAAMGACVIYGYGSDSLKKS